MDFAFLGLKDWGDWGDLATIAAVFVNGAFLFFLIKQVQQGRSSAKAAERSADAAQNAVKEALYARIDQQAPRVIALLDAPVIGGVQSPGELSWKSDYEAVVPRDKDNRMYVGVTGTLINEGKGTARISLNGYADWISEEDDEPLLTGPLPKFSGEHILRPGEQIRFHWSDSHTIEEWTDSFLNASPPNPRGACFMEIIVHDYFKEGVVDHIFLEMSGRPLVPVDGDNGHWKVPDKPEFAAVSYPIERAHLRENNYKITPPWSEVYDEWNKLQESSK